MNNKTILVVEDDIVSCELFRELFGKENIESFLIVNTGEEAIESFKATDNIQLVLMDYKLPGMDGCETIKKIRKIKHDIYVVMQTAYAYDIKKGSFNDCHVDDFLTKPIIYEEFFRIINKYYYNTN
ncbi:MAG: response regulator [Bacteroidales bacterium]|nr:response regulator [Bacteroidales bacterium]